LVECGGISERVSWSRSDAAEMRATLIGICRGLRVEILRTFTEDYTGVVVRSEVDGGVEAVDWFQYYGSSVAARLGLTDPAIARVTGGAKCINFDDGSVALWLGDQLEESFVGRKAIAELLNVRLRPMYITNPQDGTRVERPWR
jgi:hypothetical protein